MYVRMLVNGRGAKGDQNSKAHFPSSFKQSAGETVTQCRRNGDLLLTPCHPFIFARGNGFVGSLWVDSLHSYLLMSSSYREGLS